MLSFYPILTNSFDFNATFPFFSDHMLLSFSRIIPAGMRKSDLIYLLNELPLEDL